jgi:prevent-host-death family protein
MRHEILSVSKAKARLLELTRKIQKEGRAYVLTRDGEPVSALVPIEDYEALLETMDVLCDKKTMKDLSAALADERGERLFRRDSGGRWLKLKRARRVP